MGADTEAVSKWWGVNGAAVMAGINRALGGPQMIQVVIILAAVVRCFSVFLPPCGPDISLPSFVQLFILYKRRRSSQEYLVNKFAASSQAAEAAVADRDATTPVPGSGASSASTSSSAAAAAPSTSRRKRK
jgi:hypothetical protein